VTIVLFYAPVTIVLFYAPVTIVLFYAPVTIVLHPFYSVCDPLGTPKTLLHMAIQECTKA